MYKGGSSCKHGYACPLCIIVIACERVRCCGTVARYEVVHTRVERVTRPRAGMRVEGCVMCFGRGVWSCGSSRRREALRCECV